MPETPTPLADQRLRDLLDALASKVPAPGGGAAAGIVGAAAAATAGMVVAYSLGRKSLAEHQPFLEDVSAQLTRARSLFLELADEDAAAYTVLNALMKLPEDHPDRRAGWDAAVAGAIAPPRAMLATGAEVLRVCESLCGRINHHLISDLGVAAVLSECAARSAAWSITVNLPLLGMSHRGSVHAEIERLVGEVRERAAKVEAQCN